LEQQIIEHAREKCNRQPIIFNRLRTRQWDKGRFRAAARPGKKLRASPPIAYS
jgi:hypothetical protein